MVRITAIVLGVVIGLGVFGGYGAIHHKGPSNNNNYKEARMLTEIKNLKCYTARIGGDADKSALPATTATGDGAH